MFADTLDLMDGLEDDDDFEWVCEEVAANTPDKAMDILLAAAVTSRI